MERRTMTDVMLPQQNLDDPVETGLDDGFKRRIAMLVMGITLFGSLLAYAEARAGNDEARAAREAQRLAVSGLGAQVASEATLGSDREIYARTKLLDRARVDSVRQKQNEDAQRLSETKQAVGSPSPLVSDPAYADDLRPEFYLRRAADEGVAAVLEGCAARPEPRRRRISPGRQAPMWRS